MPALIVFLIILIASCSGCTTTQYLTDEEIADCFRRVDILRKNKEHAASDALQRETIRILMHQQTKVSK